MQLLVTLDDASFNGDGPHRARWFFQRQPDGGGDLEYYAFTDFNTGDAGSEDELMEVRSRWLASGEGRADALAYGGDALSNTSVTLTQCWTGAGDLTAQLSGLADYFEAVGDPGTDCPFSDVASVENLPEY